ncbi:MULTISPECIES: cation:proton antiporter [Anaerococcus]|uniref:Potassium transporter n=1 Tax=Anaerococcus octavius TaxID=54007 RepID=A0A2I1MB44_9FIRM|nr:MULTISPECIES: cation:proton antiporter [Anaerococcus]MBS6105428.1 cation:proton antiporter [Anaerococcus sp.]MDU2598849.1 cation:proton antiporter [Anaerococcus sp.]PKZ17355.1 potassium transporter [Anaerococcus octavius]
MLTDIAVIFLLGIVFAKVFEKMGLAPIIGMLMAGIIISPHQLNIVSDTIINLSADLRQIALVVILTRAGLSLNFDKLKKVGRPAILLSFVPASIEMLAIIFFSQKFFNIDTIDAGIMAAVLSAVSPAIVVPRMIKLINEGYGGDKNIPEMILAGASVDDVFVIVFFSSFLALKTGGKLSAMSFLNIPISIITGIFLGIIIGKIFVFIFEKININEIYKTMIFVSLSFLMLKLQSLIEPYIAMSALIAIMAAGIVINRIDSKMAKELLGTYNRLWKVFELFLFVLVGISVDLAYIKEAGLLAVLLIIIGLIFRMIGVNISLIGTNLDKNERVFTSFAYLPKATVQAAIGPVALSMGLNSGNLILSVSVIAILLTAPLGAILTDKTYKKLLKKS